MNAAARDIRLSLQARAIAFWIYENPSEAINPEAIATANKMTTGYVRKLLAELAGFGYLVAPQKYKAAKGRFAYTPYTFAPQAQITATDEQPSRMDNQNGQPTVTDASVTAPVEPVEYAPVHAHESAADTRDAATRVTDLSLRAKDLSVKDTPLNPPTATTEPIAPDGAQVLPSKPKRERRKPDEIPQDDTYHRLQKGVMLRSWGVNPDEPETRDMLGDADYGRIGRLVKWLRQQAVTPEKLAAFYAWYKQQYATASAPKDLDKFRGHFAAFTQAQRNPVQVTNPAYVPVVDRPRMPVTELVSLDIVNAGRKAVPS